MGNKYTGTVLLSVDGGDVPLRFDWEAIAALHSTYGKEWEAEVQRIVTELDSKGLANILAIGSEHDAQWWMEHSPPFVLAAKAAQEALHLAFFGAGGLDDRPTLAHQLKTLLSHLSRSGSNSAGDQITSGS